VGQFPEVVNTKLGTHKKIRTNYARLVIKGLRRRWLDAELGCKYQELARYPSHSDQIVYSPSVVLLWEHGRPKSKNIKMYF